MDDKINLAEKLATFDDRWSPKIIAQLNDYDVQVVKVKGEFVWHKHDETDDLFLVLDGHLTIQLRDGNVELDEGELFVVRAASSIARRRTRKRTSCSSSPLARPTPVTPAGRWPPRRSGSAPQPARARVAGTATSTCQPPALAQPRDRPRALEWCREARFRWLPAARQGQRNDRTGQRERRDNRDRRREPVEEGVG